MKILVASGELLIIACIGVASNSDHQHCSVILAIPNFLTSSSVFVWILILSPTKDL